MRSIGRARLAVVLVAATGLIGLSACADPKKTPTYVCDTGGSAPSPPAVASAPPSGEPLSVEQASEEAKAAVAEAEVRAADGTVPLVTVEQTPAGPQIASTPVANEDEAAAVAESAAADGDLVVVEPDSIVTVDAEPNDPEYKNGRQYALAQLGFVATWDAGFDGPESGANQTVAVLDTGVYRRHPDLGGTRVLSPGMTFGGYGPATEDNFGHGTRVAGIIAAMTNNATGVAGSAPAARILPVRVLDDTGRGLAGNVAQGVVWAVDHGHASVINLSLGGSTDSDVMHQAVQYAVSKNVPVISSSGNSGRCGTPAYPAAYPEVLAVGATGKSKEWAPFSTTAPYVNVVAPGIDIWSTYRNGGYNTGSGTSFSTPYVAAAAAIVRARHPGFTATGVYLRLIDTAVDLGSPGWDPFFGSGLVNVKAAAG